MPAVTVPELDHRRRPLAVGSRQMADCLARAQARLLKCK